MFGETAINSRNQSFATGFTPQLADRSFWSDVIIDTKYQSGSPIVTDSGVQLVTSSGSLIVAVQ